MKTIRERITPEVSPLDVMDNDILEFESQFGMKPHRVFIGHALWYEILEDPHADVRDGLTKSGNRTKKLFIANVPVIGVTKTPPRAEFKNGNIHILGS